MSLTDNVKYILISCKERASQCKKIKVFQNSNEEDAQYKEINVFESWDEEDEGSESAVKEETGENNEAHREIDASESEKSLKQKQQYKKINPRSQLVSRRSLIADAKLLDTTDASPK